MFNKWPCGGTTYTQASSLITSKHQSPKPIGSCPKTEAVDQPSSPTSSTVQQPWKTLKRSWSDDIIDSEDGSQQRKKRRLRLDLVTSKLSRPYADPATHIIGTHTWRAGPWARQKFAGGKLLQKAAIFNSIAIKRRKGSLESTSSGDGKFDDASPAYDLIRKDLFVRGYADNLARKSASWIKSDLTQKALPDLEILLTPSDYDAFDIESEAVDPEDDLENQGGLDDEENNQAIIHSDFRSLESSDTDPDFFDTSWSFVDTGDPEVDESRAEISLVMENERKDEVSIAPFQSTAFPFMTARTPTVCR